MGPDDLTPEETAQFEALAAEGDQAKLMKFINGLSCKYDMKPANFGDGVHHTCDATGGKKRKSRKKRAGSHCGQKGGEHCGQDGGKKRKSRKRRAGSHCGQKGGEHCGQDGGKKRRKSRKMRKSRKHKKSHKKRRH